MSDLIRDNAGGVFGNTIDLPVVPLQTGSPQYIKLVSGSFAAQNEVTPVTVRISEARLSSEVDGVGAGRSADSLNGGIPVNFTIDWEYRNIKAVVEWERGNARFAMECDPGCSLVLDATSVSVYARVELAISPRRMSASLTRGAFPGPLKAPLFTTPPIDIVRVAAPFSGVQNRVYVPPYARTLRIGSITPSPLAYAPCAIGVFTFYNFGPGVGVAQMNEPIWVSSWLDEIPIPSESNGIYLQPCQANARVLTQFTLSP